MNSPLSISGGGRNGDPDGSLVHFQPQARRRIMGEPAKAFWIEEEEKSVPEVAVEFEDVALLSTGIPDVTWEYGTD